MNRKLYCAITLICFSGQFVFGQQAIPVDLLTGRPQINIPITSISEGNISVPIGLHYSSSGAQLDYLGGSAGEGWQLQAGGAVHRRLRGLPDDMENLNGKKGWLFTTVAADIGNWQPNPVGVNEPADWSFLNNLGYNKDTEPDVFSFSAPGLSGSFIFGNDKQLKLIPYQDVKIEIGYATDNTIADFTITTNRGVKYFFNLAVTTTRTCKLAYGVTAVPDYFKTAYQQYKDGIAFKSLWSLSKIEGSSGEIITFSYDFSSLGIRREDVEVFTEAGGTLLQYYFEDSSYGTSRLTGISATLQDIDFDWGADGLLSSVSMTNTFSSPVVRGFNLMYEYVKNENDPNGPSAKRTAFLVELKEVIACSPAPGYKFAYKDVTFLGGWASSTILQVDDEDTDRDLWGFHNGKAVSKIPNIFVYNTATKADRYRPLLAATPNATLTGADRTVDPLKVAGGMLKSLSYPNGVTINITYEPNSYFDTYTNTTIQAGGVRVKQTTSINGGTTNYEYVTTTGESSGKQTYPVAYAFTDFDKIIRVPDSQAPEAGILYGRVTTKQTGRGKIVYDYGNPAMYPQISDNDWSATHMRYARPSTSVSLGTGNHEIKNDYFTFPYATNTNYSFERGLLLKQTVYNEAGNILSVDDYTYQRLGTTEQQIKAIKYEALTGLTGEEVFLYGNYLIKANLAKVLSSKTTTTYSEINPTEFITSSTSYNYSPSHHLLESTSTTNSDGTEYKTKYKYAADFIFGIVPSQTDSKGIYDLKVENRHGTIIEVTSTANDGTEQVIGSQLNTFTNFNGKTLLQESYSSPGSTAFQAAHLTNNELVIDADYELSSAVDRYTAKGLPITTHDDKHNIVSTLYAGYYESVPIAQIVGACADEVIYDGFEASSTSDIDGYSNTNDAWTGTKARALTAGQVLASASLTNVRGLTYRVTVQAKASGAAQLTVNIKNGSTTTASTTLSYTPAQAGNWAFLEGEISMLGVSDGFTLELSANAGITLDDVAFYPENASIGFSTYKPMVGKTSATNDRGKSVFYGFDAKNRLKYLMNQDKDVVRFYEYQTYLDEIPELVAGTKYEPLPPVVGVSYSFEANDNSCLTGVNYKWLIDNVSVQESSNPALIYTFNEFKKYTLGLEASSSMTVGTAISSVTINPEPEDLVLTFKTTGANTIYSCDVNSFDRTFQVLNVSGCYDTPVYEWYYKLQQDNTWLNIPNEPNSILVFDISEFTSPDDYHIKVIVNSTCTNEESAYSEPVSGEKISGVIYYINNEPCQ